MYFGDVRLRSDAYVSNFARSLARSRVPRALRDIFETGDKDIKKGRATSCPAGGHWRGINHPREGLHFNARGWISNARARRSEIASATTGATGRCNSPVVLCNARAMWRLSEVHIPRYRCSGRVSGKPLQDDAGDKENRRRSETGGLVFFLRSSPPPFFFHSALMYVTGFHVDQSSSRQLQSRHAGERLYASLFTIAKRIVYLVLVRSVYTWY